MKIKEITCKTILTESSLPEVDYVLNPYVGCGHGCRYCYASFMRRFTGHGHEPWGSFVDVRINAAEVLARQLRRRYTGGLLFGSVTDCYMPLEKRYRITRACLEVLAEKRRGLKVSILTKSQLVTRDIDLLGSTEAEVGLTINSHDNHTARIFEPRASRPHDRFLALKKLHDAGISTYVFIGPILPGLTDFEKILSPIAGIVDSVMGEVLNFRGCATVVENIVGARFPSFLDEWKFARSDPDGYAAIQRKKLRDTCKKYGLPLIGFYVH